MNTIVLKSTHLEDAGASQSMDVKKCNRDNAFQTSRSAPLIVLTPGPVFQVQSEKEENYIKCRKLRGLRTPTVAQQKCKISILVLVLKQNLWECFKFPQICLAPMAFEKPQVPQTLDQRLFPPKVHFNGPQRV